MKGILVLALCLLATGALASDGTCATCPITDPPGPTVRCPECVNAGCTPNMCNQAIGVPYPGDCTKFCICDSSGAIEMNCPPGLVWDNVNKVCNWPDQSTCSNDDPYPGCDAATTTTTTTTRPPTTTTTTRPTTTTTRPQTTTTTTRPPTTTTTTRPTTTTTPVRTTTTTTRPTTTTTRPAGTTTTTRPVTTTARPQDPTLPCQTDPPGPTVLCPDCVNAWCTPNMCNQAIGVPFPGDCTKYCLCNTAGAIQMPCPPGLVWDDVNKVCNWPSATPCNNGPFPGC